MHNRMASIQFDGFSTEVAPVAHADAYTWFDSMKIDEGTKRKIGKDNARKLFKLGSFKDAGAS